MECSDKSFLTFNAIFLSLSLLRFCEYRATTRSQTGRKEILEDMCDMSKELLEMYKINRGAWPQRLVFYRDGVSEGQFGEGKRMILNNVNLSFTPLIEPHSLYP